MERKTTKSNQVRSIKAAPSALFAEEMLLRIKNLGIRIRQARINRKWRQIDLVEKTGLSRSTIEAIEKGKPATAISAYLHVLWVMGLDRELDLLADPGLDREGLALTYSLNEKRVKLNRSVDNDF